MQEYEVTFTATVRIRATNAVAAKASLYRCGVGGRRFLRLGGACSGGGAPPNSRFSWWRWRIQVLDEKISPLRRVTEAAGQGALK